MRLIDADALTIDLFKKAMDDAFLTGNADMHRLLIQVIAHYPTIDAVPIIRCKDCRFWDWMPASTATPDYHLCRRPFQKIAMTEHDFCSKAERKDDD